MTGSSEDSLIAKPMCTGLKKPHLCKTYLVYKCIDLLRRWRNQRNCDGSEYNIRSWTWRRRMPLRCGQGKTGMSGKDQAGVQGME